jgi:hypothetical protein
MRSIRTSSAATTRRRVSAGSATSTAWSCDRCESVSASRTRGQLAEAIRPFQAGSAWQQGDYRAMYALVTGAGAGTGAAIAAPAARRLLLAALRD